MIGVIYSNKKMFHSGLLDYKTINSENKRNSKRIPQLGLIMSEISPRILKSTRHSKIAGNFGEALLLYWLSKHGFECATLDHTGIDLIARNPHNDEVMGISVKSRTRT